MKKRLKYAIFKTKWGFFGLLADNKGLLRTVMPAKNFQSAKKYLLVGIFSLAKEDRRLFPELQKSIIAYYKGTYVNFYKLVLSIISPGLSDFSHKVVKVCKAVPIGKTVTYSQLAKKAGFPKAGRAVGNILAKNPLPLLIPCHRVIRADGRIGNFSAPGGSRMKKRMLEHEKLLVARASSLVK